MYEFQAHQTKIIILGFHHLWQYTMSYYQGLCDRLGITITMPEAGGRKAANDLLTTALKDRQPVVAWTDRAHLPYFQLPESMKGHIGHIVAVCGSEDDAILVDDRAAAPFCVPADIFADARARISSYKSRVLRVEQITEPDTVSAIRAGLHACVDHLSSDSDSFSLPTLRKWGRMMTDTKNKKGWPILFKDRRGLYGTLRSMFEGIALDAGGGGLRGLYAQFLIEAAETITNPQLHEVAQLYNDLSALWLGLAEAALPDEVAPFREAKALLRERHQVLMQGGDAWETTRPITDQLRGMSAEYNIDFPMDDAGITALFKTLQDHLLNLYEREQQALTALKNSL